MYELLVATSNPGKYREMMEVLQPLEAEGFKFHFLKDLGIKADDLEESGETFRENAFIKAKYFFDKTGMLTLAEDSGILVDALPGELGVKTRRWGAGEHASDQEWIDHFMERMESEEQRGAKFVCCACLLGEELEDYFQEETRGLITRELLAPIMPGIPVSSCFMAEGEEKVYAAMNENEKNAISHRGKAMKSLYKKLLELKA